MRAKFKLIGLKRVTKNMSREVKRIKNRTKAGLRHGGLIIIKRAKELTPVETGNLRGSASVRRTQGTRLTGLWIELGYYGVDYAIAVHETPGRTYKTGEWKFLEKACSEKSEEALEAVRKKAKV